MSFSTNKTSLEAGFLRDLYLEWGERMIANPAMTMADLRSMQEELEKATLEPENVTYKNEKLGGVDVIWAYPNSCDRSKVLIYTHGGGFQTCSASSHRKLAAHVAKGLNVSTVILDYRLAPENPYPAQLEDTTNVYKALLDSGIKPENTATIGDSAGGNLAISSVLKFRELGLELPSCVITFSPWLDMELSGSTLDSNAETDAFLNREVVAGVVDRLVGHDPSLAKNPLINPLYADYNGFPPLYINAGGDEVLLDDAVRLHKLASDAGVNSTLSIVDGMQHVFPILAGRAPEANEEINKIANWYQSVNK